MRGIESGKPPMNIPSMEKTSRVAISEWWRVDDSMLLPLMIVLGLRLAWNCLRMLLLPGM